LPRLHVAAGLVWLAVMMAQVAVKGIRATVERRLLCFALFCTPSTSLGLAVHGRLSDGAQP